MNWPKRHFWRDEVRANTALTEVTDRKAVVTISSPAFARKALGGPPIRPKRGKWLTLPKTAEAYRAGSASLFPGKLHRNRKRDNPDGLTKALYDQTGVMQYALAEEVNPPADPRAWPDFKQLDNALLDRARAMYARILRPKG
jgi:hypothetical protein